MAASEHTPLVGNRDASRRGVVLAKVAAGAVVVGLLVWFLLGSSSRSSPAAVYEYTGAQADNAYNVTLLSAAQRAQFKVDQAECIALTRACQAAPRNGTVCTDGMQCWMGKLIGAYLKAKVNMYDLRLPCDPVANPLCYDFSPVARYLDSERVREFLHVSPAVGNWLTLNQNVTTAFVGSGDWSMNFHEYGKTGFNAAKERAFVTHDPLVYLYADAMAADNAYNITFLNASQIAQMKEDNVVCVEMSRQCRANPANGSICMDEEEFSFEKHLLPYFAAGRNPYDIREPCDLEADPLCEGDTHLEAFLSADHVRRYLNVHPGKQWAMADTQVGTDFIASGDNAQPSQLLALAWRGKSGFNSASERRFFAEDAALVGSPAVDAGTR
ncbi:hypothetical protein PybrP1_009930 [[Pythium] brassicae (nom. inval.)]|nr:hypothetical protein PybrP1_009930 [[Pythium] brassicae (nom. inval.)]